MKRHYVYGDGTCNFDSNHALMWLLYFSFLPSVILRTVAALKFRKSDPLDFRLFSEKLDLIHHATFGSWTLVSLFTYMKVSPNCKEMVVMSMINFQISLIIGCFSAVHVLLFAIVLAILIPLLAYSIW